MCVCVFIKIYTAMYKVFTRSNGGTVYMNHSTLSNDILLLSGAFVLRLCVYVMYMYV